MSRRIHDNRRHLIVADTPVEFIGEMEIFQLTAPGPGTYRIEHIALLHERPEASPRALEILNLTIRVSARRRLNLDGALALCHIAGGAR